MAHFTSTHAITGMQWGAYFFQGAAGTHFWIPDSAVASFIVDPGPVIEGLSWVDTLDPLDGALLVTETVPGSALGLASVDTPQLADAAVTEDKVDDAAITFAKLLLKDSSGSTVLTPAGWSGSWADFDTTHLYNGNFAVGTLGSLPMWTGTGDQAPYKINLPYWLPWSGSPSSAAATYAGAAGWPSEHVVGLTFGATGSATSNNASLSSDLFPIIPSGRIGTLYYRAYTVPGGVTLNRLLQFDFFTAAGVWISESHITNSYTSSASAAVGVGPDVMAPANARFAQVTFSTWETVAHDATTEYDLGAVWVTLAPSNSLSSLDGLWDGGGAGGTTGGLHLRDTTGSASHGVIFGEDTQLWRTAQHQLTSLGIIVPDGTYATLTPATLSGSVNNWNPGSLLGCARIDMTSIAAYNITGMVAGTTGQRIFLWNDSAYSITLKHNSASSSAGNKFYCPGAADVVIRTYGSVDLEYFAGFWLPLGI